MSQVYLNLVSRFLTDLHHKYWGFQNKIKNYQVKPFSARYWWTRQQLVAEICENTFADPEEWDIWIKQPRFQFYDERIVEYSWAMLKICQLGKKNRFLDVGCVMNTSYCLEKLLQQFSDIHFLNLVSEPLASQGRISFHCQDIRYCDLPKNSFDCITCISTLEHVGGDNSYNNFSLNGTAEIKQINQSLEGGWQKAFISLMELLVPDGLLLVSMPWGGGVWKNGEYQIGKQDLEDFHKIASCYNRKIVITFIEKDENGWHFCSELQDTPRVSELPAAGANAVVLIETINH
ncbi:MAG TPA: class I SAM-dependent methyltransferase [Halomicronema sp.]